MNKIKDLAEESQAVRILDYEEYGSKIQKILQRVKEATMSFQVHTRIFI